MIMGVSGAVFCWWGTMAAVFGVVREWRGLV